MTTFVRLASFADLTRTLFASIGLATFCVTDIAAQSSAPVIGKTYSESTEGTAPVLPVAKGAPNIIWILLDDVGFGASSAFGGQVNTPNIDALAAEGLRYTNFNTTAVCAPSRAALLTGRNHHMVGMGLLPQKLMAAEFPGYTGRLQPEDGTIAQYQRDFGYSTYWLGKGHVTPDEEATDLGPFDRLSGKRKARRTGKAGLGVCYRANANGERFQLSVLNQVQHRLILVSRNAVERRFIAVKDRHRRPVARRHGPHGIALQLRDAGSHTCMDGMGHAVSS
jgi:hypothetical protein